MTDPIRSPSTKPTESGTSLSKMEENKPKSNTVQDQTSTEGPPTTEGQTTAGTQTTTDTQATAETLGVQDQLLDEVYFEPAYLTTEIDAMIRSPPQDPNLQSVFELIALASHHLQLNNMTDDDGILNVCHVYNYTLEKAKTVRQLGAPCNEMVYLLGVLKQNMTRRTGTQTGLVRQWAQQSIDAMRIRRQLP